MVCAARRRSRRAAPKAVGPSPEERADGYCGVTYRAAQRRLAGDPEGLLRVGLNCCAVCASQSAFLVSCAACGRIVYCGAACQRRDAAAHARVCGALRRMAPERLEEMGVEESVDEAAMDRSDCGALPGGAAALAAWRDEGAALALSFPLSAAWAAGAR